MSNVKITLENYRCFSAEAPARFEIGPGFTAFVGQNNSGKSSALRLFYELRNVFSQLTANNGNFIQWSNGNSVGLEAKDIYDQQDIFNDLSAEPLRIQLDFEHGSKGLIELTRCMLGTKKSEPTRWGIETFYGPEHLPQTHVASGFQGYGGNDLTQVLNAGKLVADCSAAFDFGLAISRSIYIGPFRNAINVGSAQYYDIQVGDIFAQQWDGWKTGNSRDHNRAIRRVTDDIKRIFDLESLEISATPDNKTLHLTVDGRPFKLNELGAGLTQFVLVLGNALTRTPEYIFIDEPELNLHPSLQIDFLTTLASYAKRGVVFATHSLGLARSLAPRIYTFQKEKTGSVVSIFEQTPNYAEFLGEMSYSGYKALGYDKVLLVEGVKDVSTAHQFLRMLGKDHKIVVIPLGGNQLARGGVELELGELKRLSNNIAALVDSERDVADGQPTQERLAFQKTCEKLGFKVLLTERRAIENYLTEAAIKSVKSNKYSALQPFQKLKDATLAWSKDDNWRIAREMKFSDIENTDLGRFFIEL